MTCIVSDLEKIAGGDDGEEKGMKPTTKEEFYRVHCGFETI